MSEVIRSQSQTSPDIQKQEADALTSDNDIHARETGNSLTFV